MNTELPRKYTQPIPVSSSTALHYRQFKNASSVTSSLGSIPEASELLKIKADLESILPISEKRIRNLQRDLSVLKKNIKIRDPTESEQRQIDQYEQQQEHTPIRKTAGKTMNPAILEKMQVKIELLDDPDMPHTNTNNKNQLERQLALEALRRKRRRDDDSAKERTEIKMKRQEESESRQHQKKKKVDMHKVSDEVDFIRVKPKDQVPIMNFWNVIDPYFAPLTEEDRSFLLPKEDDEKSYVIPPLGKHYLDVWGEDELVPAMTQSSSHSSSSSSSSINSYLLINHPITNEDLLKQDISCGGLTERLLSSLLVDEHQQTKDDEDEDDDIVDSEDIIADRSEEDLSEDLIQFEERLKRELRYVGLFGEDDVDWNSREDDEICAELRAIAKELKEQHATNELRKEKLLNVVDNQLQYEQYRHVLDNLDAQVEQCYLKRFRNQKSKKRKAPTTLKTPLSENAIHAMSKRKAWVDALEGIFKDKNMTTPTESIYEDETTVKMKTEKN